MTKFLVPPSLHPGLYRLGGFIKTGETCHLEDLDECLSPKLIPLDVEAYEALTKKFGAEVIRSIHGDGPVKLPEVVVDDDRKTLRQMATEAGAVPPPVASGKKARHSDR